MLAIVVTGINTLICQVEDMDRAVSFYRDVLGLTPGVTTPYWSDFMLGGIRIGLHPRFRNGTAPCGAGGWVIGVETKDLAALRTRLAEAGRATASKYHEVPGGVVLDFSDPDGNALQAIQLGAKMSDLS